MCELRRWCLLAELMDKTGQRGVGKGVLDTVRTGWSLLNVHFHFSCIYQTTKSWQSQIWLKFDKFPLSLLFHIRQQRVCTVRTGWSLINFHFHFSISDNIQGIWLTSALMNFQFHFCCILEEKQGIQGTARPGGWRPLLFLCFFCSFFRTTPSISWYSCSFSLLADHPFFLLSRWGREALAEWEIYSCHVSGGTGREHVS